jgi:cyanate permease
MAAIVIGIIRTLVPLETLPATAMAAIVIGIIRTQIRLEALAVTAMVAIAIGHIVVPRLVQKENGKRIKLKN